MSKPLWDLWRDGITQGFIKVFLACPEQARLKYIEGLSIKTSSEPLEFGSAFHAIEANVCQRQSKGKKGLKTDLIELIAEETTIYENKHIRDTKMAKKDQQGFGEMLSLVELTLQHYFKQWEDSKTNWVCREVAFAEPYAISPANVFPAGPNRSVLLRGRWDGLFDDKQKKLRLLETKTKARIDEDGIQATLPTDIQTMLYCCAAKLRYGRVPAGVVYNVVRRSQLRPKKGEDYFKEYIPRVHQDMIERPGFYFMRWQVDFTPSDLDKWEHRVLNPIVERIVEWYESIKSLDDPFKSRFHYMNPDALYTQYGRSDMFNYLTSGGNTFGYTRRKEVYPELVDD